MRLLTLCLFLVAGVAVVAAESTGPEPEVRLGAWIWDETVADRQECRFVRGFEIPGDARVESALVRITADNSYRLFLDGLPIGQGGDWRVLIEYDITQLLAPGRHVLAVNAVNDFDVAGLIAGVRIRLADGTVIEIVSDESRELAPASFSEWTTPPHQRDGWRPARVVKLPVPKRPPQVYRAPPLLPPVITVWQRKWFQLALVGLAGAGLISGLILATLLILKTQAERVVRRERSRLAGDLHDNLGGGLTQLLLLGEGAIRASAEGSPPQDRLERLCDQARDLMRGMNESIWLIDSERDTLRDLAAYIVRYAETFFRETGIRCRFDIAADLPGVPCHLGVRRNLFLAIKEVLNNIVRHAQAREVSLAIHYRGDVLQIRIRDDGRGFDPEAQYAGNGLRNIRMRAHEAGGQLSVRSRPGEGSEFLFAVPVAGRARPRFRRR